MTKLTIIYEDGRKDVVIINELTPVSCVIKQIKLNCLNHNLKEPIFEFDDWENY